MYKQHKTNLNFVCLQSLAATTTAGIFVCKNEKVMKQKRSE